MSLKFTDTEQSKLFVTGCPHFNHDPKWSNPLWKMRGYDSSEDMTLDIIYKINEECRDTDTLLILGDFCLNTDIDEFFELIELIEPQVWMLRGNHNNPWEKQYNRWSIEKYGHIALGEEWQGMKFLGDYIELIWNKKKFICNHYPYAIWNGMQNGFMSLHSHNHGSYIPSLPDSIDGKQLDCGWDVHKKPLTFDEIMDIMNKKHIILKDHHDVDTNGGF